MFTTKLNYFLTENFAKKTGKEAETRVFRGLFPFYNKYRCGLLALQIRHFDLVAVFLQALQSAQIAVRAQEEVHGFKRACRYDADFRGRKNFGKVEQYAQHFPVHGRGYAYGAPSVVAGDGFLRNFVAGTDYGTAFVGVCEKGDAEFVQINWRILPERADAERFF